MESKKRLNSLRTVSDFATLRQNGRSFHPTPWLMVSYLKQDRDEVRCAWTISRKTAPAVVRNRLKRWSREFLRRWVKNFTGGVDFNLIFKSRGKDFYRKLDHTQFDQALGKVINRFEKA